MVTTPLAGPQRQIVEQIFLNGPLPRAALATKLGMATGSLTRLTRPLVEAGLLGETSASSGRIGRPTVPLALVADSHYFVGAKLTGKRVAAVLADLNGQIITEVWQEFTSTGPDAVVDSIARAVDALQVSAPREVTAACVTFGGRTTDRRTVDFAPFLGWADVPLADMVEERLGFRATIQNDLVALAETERLHGFGRDTSTFALLTLGEGIGYALIAGGRVVPDLGAGLEMLAHQHIDAAGPLCPQGHRGCAAAYLTTEGMAGSLRVRGAAGDVDRILELARSGDPDAHSVLSESAGALGILLAAITNSAFPRTVVVCGEGVELAKAYRLDVIAAMTRNWRSDAPRPRLEFKPFDHIHWAQGAAVVAMKSAILGD